MMSLQVNSMGDDLSGTVSVVRLEQNKGTEPADFISARVSADSGSGEEQVNPAPVVTSEEMKFLLAHKDHTLKTLHSMSNPPPARTAACVEEFPSS